jgi:hypothetical protein
MSKKDLETYQKGVALAQESAHGYQPPQETPSGNAFKQLADIE